MIMFLGDSFTWGQGLAFERWVSEEGKTVEYCNTFLPPLENKQQELFSFKDDIFRKSNHFPALVAKHFNCSYVTQFGNGGTNSNIRDIIHNLQIQFGSSVNRAVEAFVIQFTDYSRSATYDKNLDIQLRKQVEEVETAIKKIGPIPWFGISWRSDIGNILEKYYFENFVPLNYNGVEYNNFDILNDKYPKLYISNCYTGLYDFHFSVEGHQFISNNIINKMEKNKFKIHI